MKTTLAAVLLAASALAAEAPDLQMQTRIRQEEFRSSKVMEIASGLMDFIGPRLTGSPNMWWLVVGGWWLVLGGTSNQQPNTKH